MKARRSTSPSPPARERHAWRRAAGGAAWTLLFWSEAQLAAVWLERSATMAVAVQAAIAEWGAGKVGVTWSDPMAPQPNARAIARRIARGCALGAAAAVAVTAGALLTHGAVMAAFRPAPGELVLGLLVLGLTAVRDELFLRGMVLRVTRGSLPVWGGLLACGAAAAAARTGVVAGAGTVALFVEGLRGVALGAVWLRDRGAWMACAANAAWAWTLGSVMHGGLLDIRFATEADASTPGLLVCASAALAAYWWARMPR